MQPGILSAVPLCSNLSGQDLIEQSYPEVNEGFYAFLESVHSAVHEIFGITVCCLFCLDQASQIVDPVKLWRVSVEATKDTVNLIWTLSQCFCQFMAHEICCSFCVQLDSILKL